MLFKTCQFKKEIPKILELVDSQISYFSIIAKK